MTVRIITPTGTSEYTEVTPELTKTDVELIKSMGALPSMEGETFVFTFKEELPQEASFLLASRLEGKKASEVVAELTNAKEEKETLVAGDSEESKETSEEGSTPAVESEDEGSAE